MTTTDSIKSLIDKSKDYLDTKIELTRLKTIDKSADVLSTVVVMVSVIFLGFFFILFVSIALALMLGKWLGVLLPWFFYYGGVSALILLIIYIQREK
jgi:hypothetical protein